MEEHDVHEPGSLAYSWKAHDWTGDEAQFAAQVLQHGDVARAWGSIYSGREGKRYNHATCLIQGEELASKPYIKDYIAYVRAKIKERMEPTKDRILEELSALAFSNQADFVVIQADGTAYTDLSGLTREQLAAIQEITVDTYMEGRGEEAVPVKSVKIKLAPKTAALELLGKNQKLWTDVLEHNDLAEISETITSRRAEARRRRAGKAVEPEGEEEE